MKIAAIQMNAGTDKVRNLRIACELVRRAATEGARIVVLPEVFNYRGPANAAFWKDVVEPISGPSIAALAELAREYKIHVVAGSIFERSRTKNKAYNTLVWLDTDGNVLETYRKRNLFNANLSKVPMRESDTFLAGRQLKMVTVSGWVFGLTICYDLRFSDMFRRYAKMGANVFLVPSSFTKATGQAHWDVLLRSRAIENLSYVIAPNQAGKDGRGTPCFGNSRIISPWGGVLAKAGLASQTVLYAELEHAELQEARRRLPGIYGNK